MWHLFSRLANTAPLIHRVPTPGGIVKRAKYVARGLVLARPTSEWFDFLQHRELAVIVDNQPALYHKLQRPYLHRALNAQERLEALKQHYSFLVTNIPPETIAQIYGKRGLRLVTFILKDLGEFELRLCSSRQQKEGEFAIGLWKAGAAKELYTLSFSIWKYDPGPKEIFIGGLQGSSTANKDLVVGLTRALYGLRPKALLVFGVQQLAARWGIFRVRAVSDDTHIYRHFQKRKVLSTSYDAFWLECGGHISNDGMFDLPALFVPREIASLKVNKRQMYRRRYDLLADFADQIRAQLQDKIS